MLSVFDRSPRLRALLAALSCVAMLLPVVPPAVAQQGSPPAEEPAGPVFSRSKLLQLASPIALYPDGLLTQVLMAATYPLDVVEAARWRRANARLRGESLERALESRRWDDSVKALTAVPDVLRMMDEQIEWTGELGEAFLAQEEELLDAVQELRRRAEQAGNLRSSSQQRVVHSDNYIVIEPADPEVVYVPYYDPVVYGAWAYPDYPPYYWYRRSRPSGAVIWFGAAALTAAAIWASWNWRQRRVDIDRARFTRFHRAPPRQATWRHDPVQRRVPYRAPTLVRKFPEAKVQPGTRLPPRLRNRLPATQITPGRLPQPGIAGQTKAPFVKGPATGRPAIAVPPTKAPPVTTPAVKSPPAAVIARPPRVRNLPTVPPPGAARRAAPPPAVVRRSPPPPAAIRRAPPAPRAAVRSAPPAARAAPSPRPARPAGAPPQKKRN